MFHKSQFSKSKKNRTFFIKRQSKLLSTKNSLFSFFLMCISSFQSLSCANNDQNLLGNQHSFSKCRGSGTWGAIAPLVILESWKKEVLSTSNIFRSNYRSTPLNFISTPNILHVSSPLK